MRAHTVYIQKNKWYKKYMYSWCAFTKKEKHARARTQRDFPSDGVYTNMF